MKRCRALLCAWTSLASVTLVVAPAAAQDPPPPMVPSEPTSPDAPPPLPPSPPPFPRTDSPFTAPPSLPPVALPPPIAPQLPPDAPVAPSSDTSIAARTLSGHRFITPFLFDSPFITSDLGVTTEIGRQWSPNFPLSGSDSTMKTLEQSTYTEVLGQTGQYASFNYAAKENLTVGIDASYLTQFGGDANTAIIYGNSSAWRVQPNVRVRLYNSDSSQIALRIYGDFGSQGGESPAGVLVEIANEAQQIAANPNQQACLAGGILSCALTSKNFNAESASSSTKGNYGGGLALIAAHAFNSVFGLQAHLNLGVAYSPIVDATPIGSSTFASVPITFQVGLAPSLDFGPKVPFAIMGEYQLTVIEEPGLSTSTVDAPTALTVRNDFALGFYYTGRPNLVAGARILATFEQYSASIDSTDPDSGDVTTATSQQPLARVTGQLTARYYF